MDGGKVLLSICGNTFQITNMETMEKKVVLGRNSLGVGAIAVHPNKPLFAVAEKGVDPNILIYSYPELKVVNTLAKGTERTYSDIEFNPSGDMLASVGNAPDFLLTVWDWQREVITLHTKAFSQEVYRVQFSPTGEGRLCTSGTGHIRFWKMAKTFTGLKLQGDIGKFGNVDISDVTAFVELPDGRTISGSEDGYLLMWDGGFIEFVICNASGGPCHDGNVEFITIEGRDIITAGADGCIRTWDYAKLEFAEITEEDPKVRLKPRREVKVAGSSIKAMKKGNDSWLVQDANGSLRRLALPGFESKTLATFHAGAVIFGDIPGASTRLVTCGADGTLRCWDAVSRKELFASTFNRPATCAIKVPAAGASGSKSRYMVGFEDGVVRQLERRSNGFELVQVFKPHGAPICALAVSPDGNALATAGTDGSLFFISIKDGYTAVGCTQIAGGQPARTLCWSDDSSKLLVASGFRIIEYTRPRLEDQVDESDRRTYVIKVPSREITIRVPSYDVEEGAGDSSAAAGPGGEENAKKDADEAKEAGPAGPTSSSPFGEKKQAPDAISMAAYDKDGSVLACIEPADLENQKRSAGANAFDSKYSAVFRTSFKGAAALDGKGEAESAGLPAGLLVGKFDEVLRGGKGLGVLSYYRTSSSGKWTLLGSHSGRIEVRANATDASAQTAAARLFFHDGDTGVVSAVALSDDESLLTSMARDGSIFVFNVDLSNGSAPTLPEAADAKGLVACGKGVEDITDPSVYSLEEAKRRKEIDDKRTAAEKKKDKVREEIGAIRAEFDQLLQRNAALPPTERLSREEFEIDPELMGTLREKSFANVKAVREELAWELEKAQLQTRKLQNKFFDDVAVESIALKSFSSGMMVRSFRLQQISAKTRAEIDAVHKLLDGEEARQSVGKEPLALPAGVPGAIEQKRSIKYTKSDLVSTKSLKGGAKAKAEHENRQTIRKARNAQFAALEARKPVPGKPSAEDKKLLDDAVANMGDFKLKSSTDFVVPASQRVNAEKKQRQMLLIVDSVYSIKEQYNKKFLALRDLKQAVCNAVRVNNKEIRAINEHLDQDSKPLGQPEMATSEWPEKRTNVTDEDLVNFQKLLAEREKAKAGAAAGYGGGDDEEEDDEDAAARDAAKAAAEAEAKAREPTALELARKRYREQRAAKRSAAAEREAQWARSLLERRRRTLVDANAEATAAFDEALRALRMEKIRLDIDLKSTDLRMLTLIEEMKLLKRFETSENAMLEQRRAAIEQISKIESDMDSCTKTLLEKKGQASSCLAIEKKIIQSFKDLVTMHIPEDDREAKGAGARAQLSRMFNKKVRRRREDASDSDSSESEDSEDADRCPTDCPSNVYEKVLELRERKQAKEEEMLQINKARLDLNNRFKTLKLKMTQVQKELAKSENDLEVFQLKKQKALNQICLKIPLKLSQIKYLYNDSMPSKVEGSLVFTSEQRQILVSNLGKAKVEGKLLAKKLDDLKKMNRDVKEEIKVKQVKIKKEVKKCDAVQILKFGHKINLKVVRQVGGGDKLVDIRRELDTADKKYEKELKKIQGEVEVQKKNLDKIRKQNTACLTRIGELTKTEMALKDDLNESTRKSSGGNEVNWTPLERARDEALKLVKMQENQLTALKTEIHSLRRKGGDVFLGGAR